MSFSVLRMNLLDFKLLHLFSLIFFSSQIYPFLILCLHIINDGMKFYLNVHNLIRLHYEVDFGSYLKGVVWFFLAGNGELGTCNETRCTNHC